MNKLAVVTIAVVALVAAVFAVLWYGTYVENGFLRKELDAARGQIQDLQRQLTARSEELQKTTAQLLDVQGKLQTTQQQLDEANRRLEQTRRELESATAQLQDVQNRLRDAQAQIQDLTRQRDQLIRQRDALEAEIKALNTTIQTLKEKVYGGRDLVERLKTTLSRITLKAPQIGDNWSFTTTYVYNDLTLRSGYYRYGQVELIAGEVLELQTSQDLWLAVFTQSEYDKWRGGYSATPLAQGRGSLRFVAPSNGTYVYVIYNDLGRDVVYSYRVRYIETWRYYDTPPPFPQRPYVVGTPGVPSRDIFRMYAIYNYWLENREALAAEVEKQLGASGKIAFQPTVGSLDKHTLYALSLAALLKDAGFDVSFAAIGTDWKDPFTPHSAIVSVKFTSASLANYTIYEYFGRLPTGWMHIMTYQSKIFAIYDIYVLIDTYNVVRVVDRGLEITTAFNVIYIDGVTKLE
ncbi:hypothetical protein ODS41_10485 [Pyrobaculum sp. 3827-6]|uniref:hypothetical protein n=1 Tax=Pyrobaculum sp. 3827-6 TaxID=2983604 RepID=UPI0021DB68DE|nr:hypothetical protein [Pyrobaculum sp. 3827-6]MCU7788336.1 hypothetical protein [Pyrobaculum sp. 3827-6]